MDEVKTESGFFKRVAIKQILTETSDVKTIVLDGDIHYMAGQYLTFTFNKKEKEIRRSYSMSSAPVLNEPLSITIQRIPNGEVSRILFDNSKVGDVLLTTGAAGFFTLPEDLENENQLVFLAAGSGIVPVFSLLKTALHLYPSISILLIYSNRSVKETIFYKLLEGLRQKYEKNFSINYLFSTARDLLTARLNKSLLETLIKQHAKVSLDKMLFYLCGPFAYMRMIEIELQTLRVPQANVRKEHFDSKKPAVKSLPPDRRQHVVEIRINNYSHQLSVQYPVSILQEAKRNGVVLPYSCEVGKCGSCAAICIKGKVWMMYNEVLTEEEIKKGYVLTCNSFPVEGDVILSF
jgi:ring-1,2-phenylacetyl-CoA epoxidase subunit PaaE